MKIATHPDNAKHLDKIREDFTNEVDAIGIRPAKLEGFEVIFDDLIPAEVPSKTEFVARHDRFCEYNTTNPAEWEIFCGYVVPKMEPHFITMDSKKYTVSYRGEPRIYTW